MKTLTVGIPVYNEIDYIENTIDNICRISKEIHFQVEILVVDNFSTDGTRKYLNNLKVGNNNVSLRVIYNAKNEGANFSYDVLIKNATGYYIWVIGGQDLISLVGFKTIEELWDQNYDYLICNAKIKDEKLDKIINESLWGNIQEQSFFTVESFFEVLGGPCQALSCNIIRTDFIRPHLTFQPGSPLWGYVERLIDSIIYNRNNLRIKYIDDPLVEMLIETKGWQTEIPYASFTPIIEISEIYKNKLGNCRKILKRSAPFRDPFAIPRTFIEARALGLGLNLRLFARLRSIFGHRLIFWLSILPVFMLPKSVAKLLLRAKILVHGIRRVFRIRTF